MADYITFQPKDHFNTVLYTGNGSTQAVTGVGFQPDLVWLKDRTDGDNHQWYDVVRGVTKSKQSNNTNAEITFSDGLTAFGTDGFTLGSNDQHNGSSDNFVAWCFKAGGTGTSNTDGTVTSGATVSANTTAGFSVGSATMNSSGSWTVGHGLGATPAVVLVTATGATSYWWMWHQSLGDKSGDEYIHLDRTEISPANDSTVWNNTLPTSSVYSMGSNTWSASTTFVAYCFAEKKGFSRFGKYTGNGNADGPFIYTGFKPAFVITRRVTGATGDWQLHDNKRTPFNVSDTILFPNGSTADSQASGYAMDMLSNGFKIKTDNSGKNNSGSDYIFLAFAEEPLVSSNNVPATAK
jgi:hypothetical protein